MISAGYESKYRDRPFAEDDREEVRSYHSFMVAHFKIKSR